MDSEAYFEWIDARMDDLGAHWTRINLIFNWSIIEPEIGGGYDWDAEGALTDTLINAIYEPPNEINLLAVIQPLRNDNINPITNPEEYAAYVSALAERYDGDGVDDLSPNVRIDYFQLSSELQEWFTYLGLSAEEYAETAALTLDTLRSVNPDAKLVLIADLGKDFLSTNMKDIIRACAELGVDFSGIDLHYWSDKNAWYAKIIQSARNYLDSFGYYDAKIYSGENGTYTGCPEGWDEQTEVDQARSLVKRFVWGRAKGLDLIFWSAIVDWHSYQGNTDSLFAALGLVGNGYGPCDNTGINEERISYHSYKLLASYTDKPVAVQDGEMALTGGDLYGYAYRMREDNRGVYILWSEGESTSVSVPVNTGLVNVISLIPDSSGASEEYTLTASDNAVSLTVGQDPLMLVEEPGTEGNTNPPVTPELLHPQNHTNGLDTTLSLEWEESTDPDGDTVMYYLYLSTDPGLTGTIPEEIASLGASGVFYAGTGIGLLFTAFLSGRTGRRKIALLCAAILVAGMLAFSCGGGGGGGGGGGDGTEAVNTIRYTASGLSPSTMYYWKVVATDGTNISESPTWCFTTGE
jgi:hypothetical protein